MIAQHPWCFLTCWASLSQTDRSSWLSAVLGYGTFGNWLGHDNRVQANVIVRADLSGTDDFTIDSPACLWSYFQNPEYWVTPGANNSYGESAAISCGSRRPSSS